MFFLGNENYKAKDGGHPDSARLKHMSSFMDEYDYLSDQDKSETLNVYTNEEVIASDPDLAVFSKYFNE